MPPLPQLIKIRPSGQAIHSYSSLRCGVSIPILDARAPIKTYLQYQKVTF